MSEDQMPSVDELRRTFESLGADPSRWGPGRAQHIAWCKERALLELDTHSGREGMALAWASMTSDLMKHDDTASHPGITLGFMLIMTDNLKTADEMRKFIEGFN